jgi:hypothetical protein
MPDEIGHIIWCLWQDCSYLIYCMICRLSGKKNRWSDRVNAVHRLAAASFQALDNLISILNL